MRTALFHKKLSACKQIFYCNSFVYQFVASVSKNVNYVKIEVKVPIHITRDFLRKMERHYMHFFEATPFNDGFLVTFYVNLTSHRKEFIAEVNAIAFSRQKLLKL